MEPETRNFSLLSYIGLILMFGPMLVIGVLWYAYVAHVNIQPSWSQPGAAMTWLAAAVAAASVCILSEWFVLPFLIERDAPRPVYTPLISFTLGLVLSGGAFLIAGAVR